jgi:N-acetylmuramate 1-kinase
MSPSPTFPPAPPATSAVVSALVTSSPVVWADPARELAFNGWLAQVAIAHPIQIASLRLASADASFRRYLRVDCVPTPSSLSPPASLIIMDAPPTHENCRPFVDVAHLMTQAGLTVPQVLAWDEANGFLLLTDLGQQTMMQAMHRDSPHANHATYMQAVDVLIAWQLASKPDVLPLYNEALLRRELELFPEWYIARHRGVAVEGEVRGTLDAAFKHIVAQNLAWPSVYVHRDFMPRNLMAPTLVASRTALDMLVPEALALRAVPMCAGTSGAAALSPEGSNLATPLFENPRGGPSGNSLASSLGILDFQDAVYGPITYDIASLMRDAFLTWEEDFVLDITIRYWQKAKKAGLPVGDDFGEFYRGVEWMGLQRHLKVAGIFARLTLRDGKPQYLADTPRFIDYIRATCSRYRELKPLLRLVDRIEGTAPATGFAYGRV